jgi:hypothetical protein
MKKQFILFILLGAFWSGFAQTDDELLGLLEDKSYAEYTFYSTRIVNSHSVQMVPKDVLEFRISHRFGQLSRGVYDLFGLDAATMRLGFDYGLTDELTIGLGRSTIQKTYDGFAKYRILRQMTSKDKHVPISMTWISGVSDRSMDWPDSRYESHYSNRLSFYHQLLLARKFSENTSVQLMPTLVHRNLVTSAGENNDVVSMGAAIHQKVLPSMVINVEYFYNLPNQVSDDHINSLSVGLIFSTGWHSFSIHASNSRAMYERGFITETPYKWSKNQIHLGFNITREFHLVED